jgi:phage baseplate assembly protein W
MTSLDFVGIGWSFPPTFDRQNQTVTMVRDTQDIDESLHILLSTTIGERVMQPLYGCNLKQFLFEPTNASIEAEIEKVVEDAILYFEPRIRLDKLQLDTDAEEGRMEIMVEYTIKASNSRSNFVYPFYLQGGTNR